MKILILLEHDADHVRPGSRSALAFARSVAAATGGSVTGLLIGFLPLGICWWAGGIGGGDAKLAGAIGALSGWRFAFTALAYGIGVAALMAIFVMIQKRLVRRTLRRVWLALQLLVHLERLGSYHQR